MLTASFFKTPKGPIGNTSNSSGSREISEPPRAKTSWGNDTLWYFIIWPGLGKLIFQTQGPGRIFIRTLFSYHPPDNVLHSGYIPWFRSGYFAPKHWRGTHQGPITQCRSFFHREYQRIKTSVFRAGFLGFVQTSSQISQATETKLFLTTAHRAHVVLPFRNNDEIYDIHEPNDPFGSLELREYLMSLAWCWELSMTS